MDECTQVCKIWFFFSWLACRSKTFSKKLWSHLPQNNVNVTNQLHILITLIKNSYWSNFRTCVTYNIGTTWTRGDPWNNLTSTDIQILFNILLNPLNLSVFIFWLEKVFILTQVASIGVERLSTPGYIRGNMTANSYIQEVWTTCISLCWQNLHLDRLWLTTHRKDTKAVQFQNQRRDSTHWTRA